MACAASGVDRGPGLGASRTVRLVSAADGAPLRRPPARCRPSAACAEYRTCARDFFLGAGALAAGALRRVLSVFLRPRALEKTPGPCEVPGSSAAIARPS